MRAAAVLVVLSSSVVYAQYGRPLYTVAAPAGRGMLRNAAQGLCLDVAGWSAAGDGKALLWDCNGDPESDVAVRPERRAGR